MEAKWKVGDTLRCQPGFNDQADSVPDSGGGGYENGLTFEVTRVQVSDSYHSHKGAIYFGGKRGNGVFEFALDKVTKVVNQYEIY